MRFPKIVAHRGLPHVAPENTLASFKAALALDIDGIETDIQATKDGELIICHDELLNRTTNGHGLIKNHTLRELKSLSAGAWFGKNYRDEKIPTLREFLELVKGRDLLINLELKTGIVFYPDIEKKLITMINEYNLSEHVIVSSFNHYSLLTCKEIAPHIKTGILYEGALVDPWDYAEKIGASALHPYFPFVTSQMVDTAHFHSLMVNPYTLNETDEMKQMIAFGVDSIITNYPERLISIKKFDSFP